MGSPMGFNHWFEHPVGSPEKNPLVKPAAKLKTLLKENYP
jgi:hypothetical protein